MAEVAPLLGSDEGTTLTALDFDALGAWSCCLVATGSFSIPAATVLGRVVIGSGFLCNGGNLAVSKNKNYMNRQAKQHFIPINSDLMAGIAVNASSSKNWPL